MPNAFPCGFYLNLIAKNRKAVKCDNCDLWIRIKCNKMNKHITYELIITQYSIA